MAGNRLTSGECKELLKLARTALESEILEEQKIPVDSSKMSEKLGAHGASFVTLTMNQQLRGCIGSIEPYRSLAEDVSENAISAATKDYRFPRVKPEELAVISIEISYLTPQRVLSYSDGNDLIEQLQPGIDGVVIRDGFRRATFLPQVWKKIPDPENLLCQLCMKMGSPPDSWRNTNLDVSVYQVQEFHE